MRFLALGLVLLGCAGCASTGPQSRADACRQQVAGQRVGRALGGKSSSTTDALEDLRCDAREAEDRAEAREKSASDQAHEDRIRRERAAQATQRATADAEVLAIRRAPRLPELGTTRDEAIILCRQQRGTFSDPQRNAFSCKVGDRRIFACTIDAEGLANRCDGYIEDGDLAAARRAIEAKLGPSEAPTVSPEGFRVFRWDSGAASLILTSYERGIRMTHLRNSAGE